MIDAHVHIERGEYSLAWIDQFIEKALDKGITEIHFLEHSHRFKEFYPIYEDAFSHPVCGPYQKEWIQERSILSIKQYQELISELRRVSFPIAINWGLEICYFPGKESIVRDATSGFSWDFITGSVHWIDGWGFDHPKNQDHWKSQHVDDVYEKYYRQMIDLVSAGWVTILAHPDSIKCFHYYPTKPLTLLYSELAQALSTNHIKAEFSAGLKTNYGHEEIGLNEALLDIFLDYQVELITASDAHRPENVGQYIKKANEIIQNRKKYKTSGG